ncbi:alpha-ketoglutarate-dependent dioxygenase AlkB [Cytophagaceae bacterium YF14B1]|uniref:Alpha-ketoglutarate-dependent dioxygenase AlkB n=1 Tax=Xanthocytophaga flava TaxID=3048013 RepID=A0AAE3U866_9BACT|nr:alpha-ketoglutarate-dependent dioxygenase AlkB [Xanthocytophaga flavus]MDJ1482357.1 alpha-ketoglutarate-dependent dioxygenase AlkB [Xanthocytophaga flavus]
MIDSGFYKIELPLAGNLFEDLFHSIEFESVAKGRMGNHLVRVEAKGIPIVRTTTKYTIPAHNFSAIHHSVVEAINHTITKDSLHSIPPQQFNNALIEVYDCSYAKMNYHSDQCLDLATGSYIGVFSCYAQPDQLSEQNIRRLLIKDKITNEESEIELNHNSVVLFSSETNTKFQHKIILKPTPNGKPIVPDIKWLGITFRTSKTYIQFNDNLPYFVTGDLLELANQEQESEFFKLRGQENRSLDFVYPNLTYTLSLADRIVPMNS